MMQNGEGGHLYSRGENGMRDEVENHKTYLLDRAKELDAKISLSETTGLREQEIETLTRQVHMIQRRLIHCCEGTLRRGRANEIFEEIADQMNNDETKDIILGKIEKGVHDEK